MRAKTVIRCLSFGSLSWLRPGNDESDPYRFTNHAALFNTTGFVSGCRERRFWYVPGLLRMDVGVLFGAQGVTAFEPGTYISPGLERRGEWNRVKLDRKVSSKEEAQLVLVCVCSADMGRIDLSSRWHGMDISVVAGSALRGEQETLILAQPGARLTSQQGRWLVSANGISKE